MYPKSADCSQPVAAAQPHIAVRVLSALFRRFNAPPDSLNLPAIYGFAKQDSQYFVVDWQISTICRLWT